MKLEMTPEQAAHHLADRDARMADASWITAAALRDYQTLHAEVTDLRAKLQAAEALIGELELDISARAALDRDVNKIPLSEWKDRAQKAEARILVVLAAQEAEEQEAKTQCELKEKAERERDDLKAQYVQSLRDVHARDAMLIKKDETLRECLTRAKQIHKDAVEEGSANRDWYADEVAEIEAALSLTPASCTAWVEAVEKMRTFVQELSDNPASIWHGHARLLLDALAAAEKEVKP